MTADPGAPRDAGPADAPRRSTGDALIAGRRVGTAERDRTIDLLGDAFGAGYLTKEEFEQRIDAAARARDRGQLDALTADLPSELRTSRERDRNRARRARAARTGVRIHAGVYLGTSLLMVIIWLTVGLTTGFWYPWPIWPILGWGIGVLGHAIPVSLALRRRDGIGPR